MGEQYFVVTYDLDDVNENENARAHRALRRMGFKRWTPDRREKLPASTVIGRLKGQLDASPAQVLAHLWRSLEQDGLRVGNMYVCPVHLDDWSHQGGKKASYVEMFSRRPRRAPEHRVDAATRSLRGAASTALVGLVAAFIAAFAPAASASGAKQWFGVDVISPSTSDRARLNLADRGGVLVTKVPAASPAGDAGLRQDDLITSIGGWKVFGIDELDSIASHLHSGTNVMVEVLRGGEMLGVVLPVLPDTPTATAAPPTASARPLGCKGYNGLEWGSSISAAIAKWGNPQSQFTPLNMVGDEFASFDGGEVTTSVMGSFFNNEFYRASFRARSEEQATQLLEALSEKYGSPNVSTSQQRKWEDGAVIIDVTIRTELNPFNNRPLRIVDFVFKDKRRFEAARRTADDAKRVKAEREQKEEDERQLKMRQNARRVLE